MFRSTTVGDIYDSTTYQPRKSVGYLLSRVRVEMLTALDRELEADKRLAPLELSAAQLIIIANLAGAEGPMSASDLCKGISYDAGAMTRMLDRLESKGLIRRNRSAQDRRLMHLELTEEGRAAYPRMREISLTMPTACCAASPRAKRGSWRAFSPACSRTCRHCRRAPPPEGRQRFFLE
jgi:DNA-binding MarR family transcriptional regulator